jgi:hypothetical protein
MTICIGMAREKPAHLQMKETLKRRGGRQPGAKKYTKRTLNGSLQGLSLQTRSFRDLWQRNIGDNVAS